MKFCNGWSLSRKPVEQRRAGWYGEIIKISLASKAPFTCVPPQQGRNEDLLLFMVLKTHQTAALNGCHHDAGHQGCDHTLSLLQECFWWPGMAKQMRQDIKACKCCLQYEGGTLKAPLCPIVATAPLDLLHVDCTSIETTLELNQLPSFANVLVSKTISLSTYWHMWPLIKLQKLLLNFYMEATSLSLGHLPGSWVTEVLALPVASLRNCARSLAFNNCGLCPTTPDEQAGREITTYDYVHDWEAGIRQESWLAISFVWNSACLQCYLICSYWVQSTLFNVQTTA